MNRGLFPIESVDIPPILAHINDAPTQFSRRGTMPDLNKKWLAVVGSRACTSYGKQVVEHLIMGLAGYPVVIVSGLALGIDGLAHKAAMSAGLPTVAVPGCGLDWDVLYPASHEQLAKQILENGGCILSEFDDDQRAMDYTFPQRNRIMAGLCQATLLIEAKERSGTLITARLATEYNRDLLVVPGNIFSRECAGTHQFLKLGATPITCVDDLLQALDLAPKKQRTIKRGDVSENEINILDLLNEPLTRADLLDQLDMNITESTVLLSTMEIKGLIVETGGLLRAT